MSFDVSEFLASVGALAGSSRGQELVNNLTQAASMVCGAQYCTATLHLPQGAPWTSTRQGALTRPTGHFAEDLQPDVRSAVLAGEVVRGARVVWNPLSSNDAQLDLARGTILAVPLTLAGQVVGGVWLVRAESTGLFEADERSWATALADMAVATARRLSLRSSPGRKHDELEGPNPEDSWAGVTLEVEVDDAGVAEPGAPPLSGSGQQLVVSQLVRRLTAKARTIVGTQAMILSRVEEGQQTFLVIDADPGVVFVGEGFQVPVADTYCGMLLAGDLPPVVPDVWRHPLTARHPMTGPLGMGAYCGVPVVLPNGAVFGTLAGVDYRPSVPLSGARFHALQALGQLIGLQLGKEESARSEFAERREAFRVFVDGDVRSTVVQPIVDLGSGQISGYEALSRFARPIEGTPLRPDEVFARAARLEMSVELEQACAKSALGLLHQLPAGKYLSVNISPRTLIHRDTRDLFTAYRLQQLVVELTEHEQIDDYEAVASVLNDLRRQGARVAIDDLGAGFAGLRHLAQLRPEVVKLDISLVRNVDTDPTRAAVARAVAGFAAEIGAALVAEGIETEHEKSRMQQLGASHGQGYLLGRPGRVERVLPAHPGPWKSTERGCLRTEKS